MQANADRPKCNDNTTPLINNGTGNKPHRHQNPTDTKPHVPVALSVRAAGRVPEVAATYGRLPLRKLPPYNTYNPQAADLMCVLCNFDGIRRALKRGWTINISGIFGHARM